MTDTFFTDHPEVVRYVLKHERRPDHVARTPDGLEPITDEQRALDLYLLAEKHYYELPEASPDDVTLLQVMATALLAKQLYQLNEQRHTLTEDIALLRETTDTAIKHLAGHVSHLAQQISLDHHHTESEE